MRLRLIQISTILLCLLQVSSSRAEDKEQPVNWHSRGSGIWFSPDGLTYSSGSYAQVGPDGNRYLPSGMPFTQKISIEIAGAKCEVPAGYLRTWPKGERTSALVLHHISVLFWLPSLRPVEVRIEPPLPRAQPREPGRPPASPDEFPVFAMFSFSSDDLSPNKKFDNQMNALRLRSKGGAPNIVREYDLQRFDLEAGSTNPGQLYHNPGDVGPQLHLLCSNKNSKLPNPSCNGDLLFENENLAATVRFPIRGLPKWRQMSDGLHALVSGWCKF
jgi:hypothetical protein